MRYHVTFTLTNEALSNRDPVVTIAVHANDDADAQAFVFEQFADWELDIVEIEEAA